MDEIVGMKLVSYDYGKSAYSPLKLKFLDEATGTYKVLEIEACCCYDFEITEGDAD